MLESFESLEGRRQIQRTEREKQSLIFEWHCKTLTDQLAVGGTLEKSCVMLL